MPAEKRIREILFEHVLIGQLFYQVAPHDFIFLRVPEKHADFSCKCGLGHNAMNLSVEYGPGLVHFCHGTMVRVVPGSRRLEVGDL
jgi:hypothetical protein